MITTSSKTAIAMLLDFSLSPLIIDVEGGRLDLPRNAVPPEIRRRA
jgi:hypothetical protein